MAAKKRYKACKETGHIGINEEIVLNENWLDLTGKLDVSKMIDPLKSTGILNSKEYRDSRTEKDAGLMMSYIEESGPDGFIKFMDALRMAGYNDLAADLEKKLQNTQSETFYRTTLRIGKLALEKASAMGEHIALELVKNFGSASKIGQEILKQAYEYGKPIGLQERQTFQVKDVASVVLQIGAALLLKATMFGIQMALEYYLGSSNSLLEISVHCRPAQSHELTKLFNPVKHYDGGFGG